MVNNLSTSIKIYLFKGHEPKIKYSKLSTKGKIQKLAIKKHFLLLGVIMLWVLPLKYASVPI